MATPAGEAKTRAIGAGTAEGLLAFLDYLVEKGYATPAQVAPWGSAARQVFQQLDGDDWLKLDVRTLDLDDCMSRFEKLTRGDYKQESLAAYRRRIQRGIEAYKEYLENGKPPNFKPRPPAAKGRFRPATDSARLGELSRGEDDGQGPPSPPPTQQLIDVPFPLESGELAYVRLPRRITRGDADRMGALIKTFVIEEPRQLRAGRDDSGAEGGE